MKPFLTYVFLVLSLSQCSKKEVDPEPLAAFSVQNNNCTASCEVVFTNASKDATSYRWDFADGQSSSEPSPRHTYTVAGTYTVKLTAKGPGGSHDVTQTISIKAPPAAAVAQFSIAGGGCTAPCAVTLTNQSQNATTYQWDFGDGQTSTEQNPQHTYTQGKTYTIKLTATGPGGSSMLTKDVSIQAPPPVADFTFTGGDCISPCEVVFTNKSTNAESYKWDFGDGGTSTEASPRHQYTKGGTFQVILTATGNGKTTTKTQAVIIKITFPTKVWDKTLGGNSTDLISAVINCQDGGFLLAGTSLSNASGDKTQNSKGDYDYWVVKVNSNGVKQWDKTFGGSGSDYLTSVVAVREGIVEDFMLVGYSDSPASGDKTANAKGGGDYWVVQIDKDGRKRWDKTFGGEGNDYATSVINATTGNQLIGGYSDYLSSGDKSENSKGKYDYWVLLLDQSGSRIWDKTFGGTDNDILTCLLYTSDDNYLLAGYSSSPNSGDKSENLKGNGGDYWVIKINLNGTKLWDKTLGGSSQDLLRSVAKTSDGGFLLAGDSYSSISGDKSENIKGGVDYWVIKVNSNGTKLWDKTYGGTGRENLASVIAIADGDFLLAGESDSSISGDKSEGPRGQTYYLDYWVIRVDGRDGAKQWDKAYGGNVDDHLKSATTTLDGGYLLGGYTISPASGDKTENSRGSLDYWIIKIK